MKRECECTDECLGYLTKECRSIEEPKKETLEEVKDLAYWKANAEEDYIKVPISVLRYISELEKRSYSEEEVLAMLKELEIECVINPRRTEIKEWFEQFKKK
jgi:hypothetical protein